MRPQFHHVDAYAESEARNAPRTAPTRPQEARAVHLTAKSNIDGEEDNNDTMAERIAQVQAESWKAYKVIDENSEQAWKSFEENMFVGHHLVTKDTEELRTSIPKLKSVWNNAEYLEALAPKRTTGKIREKKSKPKATATEEDPEEFDLSNLEDSD
jgi:DNA-directed RNA polymerase-3 subunit RPC5